MKRYLIFAYALVLFMLPAHSQLINKQQLSPRQTGYTIDARLDPVSKVVTGSMNAFWVNMSNDVVPDIQLHLYMNAFKNGNSTLNIETHGYRKQKQSEYGWINIVSFKDRNGVNLTPFMNFISPDDGNISDQTVMRVRLPKPVSPGDTVFINVEFETKLPSHIRRTGYNDDFYFVAQWFPKFGVYEPVGMRYATKGGWNCHQFHYNSEFYSNHSLYTVNITVPNEYIVGSGGLQMEEPSSDQKAGTKTIRYRAEDIVDFAWTAWPGYSVFYDKWKNVEITLLIPKERTEQVGR